MSFRLFGVDVEIQFGFWFTAFMLGYLSFGRSGFQPGPIAVWMGVVLVSVLVHEYGHAFAIKRHKVEPEIALHWMGGTTTWRTLLPLRRIDHVIISLAGPFAGFTIAALAFSFRVLAHDTFMALPSLARFAILALEDVNLFWGIINLIPVLPFDGGHVLEHALGPKRMRMTAAISFLAGMGAAIYFLQMGSIWGAFIFGMGAIQSYQRFRAEAPTPAAPARQAASKPNEDPLPPETEALLRTARQALADEQLDRAMAIAEQILKGGEGDSGAPPPRAAVAALEIIGWAHHLAGRTGDAEEAIRRAGRLGPVDAALGAAVLMARKNVKEARRLLENARASGDDRKEVVGPLIQILIEQGEIARAAAVALDVVESLSSEDVRRMGEIAFEGGAFEWAARLAEAIFAREGHAEDAYDAARAHAKNGEPDRALELLRRAVAAGFSDRARAWSDAALSSLHADARHLEAVLPRP